MVEEHGGEVIVCSGAGFGGIFVLDFISVMSSFETRVFLLLGSCSKDGTLYLPPVGMRFLLHVRANSDGLSENVEIPSDRAEFIDTVGICLDILGVDPSFMKA